MLSLSFACTTEHAVSADLSGSYNVVSSTCGSVPTTASAITIQNDGSDTLNVNSCLPQACQLRLMTPDGAGGFDVLVATARPFPDPQCDGCTHCQLSYDRAQLQQTSKTRIRLDVTATTTIRLDPACDQSSALALASSATQCTYVATPM
jgi:hypothetical protein